MNRKGYSKIEKTPLILIKIPLQLVKAYSKLPNQFKVTDLRKLCPKTKDKFYNRITYQNWLSFLREIGVINLKGRTYTKKYRKLGEGCSIWLKNKLRKYEKE